MLVKIGPIARARYTIFRLGNAIASRLDRPATQGARLIFQILTNLRSPIVVPAAPVSGVQVA